MKKVFILLFLTLITAGLSAQNTISLGKELVGKRGIELLKTLDSYSSFYMVHNDTKKKTIVSVEIDGAVYVYKVLHSDQQVIINYRHDNKEHLIELKKVKKSRDYNDIHAGTFSTDVVLI